MNVKPTESDTTVHDGGRELDGTDLFTRTADVPERSGGEKLYRLFDIYVAAPLKVAMSDIRMVVGSAIILGIVFMGTVGVMLTEPPMQAQYPNFAPPFQSLAYPLGVNNLGEDLLRKAIHSTPAMIKLVIAGALISAGIGTLIGTLSGYVGGWLDRVLMVFTDTILTIPALPFIIVLSVVIDIRGPIMLGLLLGSDNWPGLARALRSQVLSIREEDATEAARAMGLSKATILRRHVVSALAPYILINLANSSKRVIFESVALLYLGIIAFSSNNWGVMLNKAYFNAGPLNDPGKLHWILVPMVCITLLSMGLVLIAQGMDRVFNVRLRAQHQKTAGEKDTQPAEMDIEPGHGFG